MEEGLEMRASLRMPVDTFFGNRCEIVVAAELTNAPASSEEDTIRRHLVADMVRVVQLALEELAAADERVRLDAGDR